jgi:hypothetical protein
MKRLPIDYTFIENNSINKIASFPQFIWQWKWRWCITLAKQLDCIIFFLSFGLIESYFAIDQMTAYMRDNKNCPKRKKRLAKEKYNV